VFGDIIKLLIAQQQLFSVINQNANQDGYVEEGDFDLIETFSQNMSVNVLNFSEISAVSVASLNNAILSAQQAQNAGGNGSNDNDHNSDNHHHHDHAHDDND
jgi:hypothetical protein